jgi:hypothetical protein
LQNKYRQEVGREERSKVLLSMLTEEQKPRIRVGGLMERDAMILAEYRIPLLQKGSHYERQGPRPRAVRHVRIAGED